MAPTLVLTKEKPLSPLSLTPLPTLHSPLTAHSSRVKDIPFYGPRLISCNFIAYKLKDILATQKQIPGSAAA